MQLITQELIGFPKTAFNQSVEAKIIKPFIEFGEARKTRLYLKSDLEEYAKNKREPRTKKE